MAFDRYLVSHGSMVVHQIPVDGRCNLTDNEDEIDEDHALKLIERHAYRRCSWCRKRGED